MASATMIIIKIIKNHKTKQVFNNNTNTKIIINKKKQSNNKNELEMKKKKNKIQKRKRSCLWVAQIPQGDQKQEH